MSENFEKIKAAPLFFGIDEAELPELLEALDAHSRRYQKGEIIMPEGEKTDSLGLVMSGSVLIVQDDFWGNRNIMARITQGGIFAESFACTGEKLTVGAEAESECEIMRLKVGRVLGSCPKSCAGHAKLVGNLISELARKNLNFNLAVYMGKFHLQGGDFRVCLCRFLFSCQRFGSAGACSCQLTFVGRLGYEVLW